MVTDGFAIRNQISVADGPAVSAWYDLSRQTVQPRWQRRRHAVAGLPAAARIDSELLRAGSRDGRGTTSACLRVSGRAARSYAVRPLCLTTDSQVFAVLAQLKRQAA